MLLENNGWTGACAYLDLMLAPLFTCDDPRNNAHAAEVLSRGLAREGKLYWYSTAVAWLSCSLVQPSTLSPTLENSDSFRARTLIGSGHAYLDTNQRGNG